MTPKKHAQCFRYDTAPSDIEKCIEMGHRVVVILRGVTGSGKTRLAQTLAEKTLDEHKYIIISSDDVQQHLLTKKVRDSVQSDIHLVIVDAENIQRISIKSLAKVATEEKYECFVVEPSTSWKHDADECIKRSKRNEEIESIEKKITEIKETPIEWEHFVNGGINNVVVSNTHDVSSTPSPSTVSQSGTLSLSTTLSMLSVSSPVSPPQIFSMAPEPKLKIMKNASTNVTMESIAYELAGLGKAFEENDYSLENEIVILENRNRNVRMVDRKIETDDSSLQLIIGTNEEIEFSLLRSIFAATELAVLRHSLQIFGYVQTFRILKAIGETSDYPQVPVDDSLILEELEAMESFTVSNMSVEEEIEARRAERAALRFMEGINNPTESDEMIARALQEQILHGDGVDTEEDTYATKLPWNWRKDGSATPIPTHRVVAKKSKKEERNHFLKSSSGRSSRPLEDVQREAVESRHRIEVDRQRMSSYNSSATSETRKLAMMEQVARRKEGVTAGVKQIDRLIRDAHNNPWNLDLHYMSVEGALELVEQSIEAVRFHLRYSNRMEKRVKIVTGLGNNSRCGARIKPRVICMLESENISYSMLNEGCIELRL